MISYLEGEILYSKINNYFNIEIHLLLLNSTIWLDNLTREEEVEGDLEGVIEGEEVEIEVHQEEEVLQEVEEDLEDLRSSLSLINMKVFLLLRDQELIYFVLKTLFQENQYTMKKELV